MISRLLTALFIICFSVSSSIAQAEHDHSHDHSHGDHAHGDAHAPYDPAGTAIHHISDGNVYTILEAVHVPLPMILYAPDKGWDFFLSNKFDVGHHENGAKAYNGYVLYHGSVHRVMDSSFPNQGMVSLDDTGHGAFVKDSVEINGKKVEKTFVMYQGNKLALDERSTLDGGLLGGGITSFYDLSITKNVLSMILVSLFLLWIFIKMANAYKARPDRAPSGVQGFLEPLFLFIRDEVAIPFIGKYKYKKFLPLLMAIFFFILTLNLFGQIPFFGSVNVTGNLAVTMVLALVVFFVVNFSGNAHYWGHIFWMPGVPTFVKPILAAVEVLGLFIKPLTLMLRLAGNISAGHIAILSFVGLIFIFGESGANLQGSITGTFMSVPLSMFMMALELLVAFVQAFVFTLLTAAFIGSAVEEHH